MEGEVGAAHNVWDKLPVKKFYAIWDTGATGSVIRQDVVDALGLKPIGQTKAGTAAGVVDSDVYLICFRIPGKIHFPQLPVTVGKMQDPVQVLIGMDVIGSGDFSVTNHGGFTDMHFTCPSNGVDFHHAEVKRLRDADHPPAPKLPPFVPAQSRNSPCKCGSGEKYKHCCEPKHKAEQAAAAAAGHAPTAAG